MLLEGIHEALSPNALKIMHYVPPASSTTTRTHAPRKRKKTLEDTGSFENEPSREDCPETTSKLSTPLSSEDNEPLSLAQSQSKPTVPAPAAAGPEDEEDEDVVTVYVIVVVPPPPAAPSHRGRKATQ
ncbi:hypothetical protein PsYK624_052670 [Phanerochaete sordida]|uniref:Uncharacterized protein n=1 Tax=Phanerochaete sordida TaxID=48140 RepID=A0A9P3LCT0_9APHY|nr:hypothetical protein PsYK624_052670 [Phanerochaete sordida]